MNQAARYALVGFIAMLLAPLAVLHSAESKRAAEHRVHHRRRSGLRRLGLLRANQDPHAQHRPPGGRGIAIHPTLLRQRRLRALALRADDRQASGSCLRSRQSRIQAGRPGAACRPVPSRCRSCFNRPAMSRVDSANGGSAVQAPRETRSNRASTVGSATTARAWRTTSIRPISGTTTRSWNCPIPLFRLTTSSSRARIPTIRRATGVFRAATTLPT